MKIRYVATNLATIAVSVTITILLAEFALSFYADRPLERTLPEVKYDDHPVRWYTLRPDQEGYTYGAPFQVDKEGIRRNRKDDHTGFSRKIVALGDSFTFGMGVADSETWPAKLEANLNLGDTEPYAVTNAGIIGYGAFQINDLVMEENLLVETDLVIYALYWNDYMTTVPPGPDAIPRINEQGYFRWEPISKVDANDVSLKRWLVNNSFFLSSLRDLRNSLGDPGPYAQEFNKLINGNLSKSNFTPVKDFLDVMQKRQGENGFKFVVVILPVHDLMGTDTDYDDIIRGMLEKQGVPYYDAYSVFDGLESRSDYFLPEKVDVHLNPRGYKVLSEGLYKMLIDSNLVE